MKGALSSHQSWTWGRRWEIQEAFPSSEHPLPQGLRVSGVVCVSLLKANDLQSCLETFIITVISGSTPLGRGCEERGALEWF